MHISYKGDYALKSMLELAIRFPDTTTTITELAKGADIPFKFLEQVLLDLKRAGFLESRRGTHGGYRLAKHPAKITLGEVVRFIEGPIEPIACADKKSLYKGCKDVYNCVFRDIWTRVAEATAEIIDTVTFEDLANRFFARATASSLDYCI
ncbi:MAG: Rrf2 family transcriptional regulator [Candidatus Omnitrophica bacterium]|nr:Rrf2 family transcriptional regulator [Candidatus Omnitrophota bacterium]